MPVAKWYPKGKLNIYRGNVDLENDDIAVMLSDSSVAPNLAHEFAGDISNEVAGQGYVAGGKSVANRSLAIVGSAIIFDADDVIWPLSTITARHAHVYDRTNGLLIAYISADADASSRSGDFKIPFDALGILRDTML